MAEEFQLAQRVCVCGIAGHIVMHLQYQHYYPNTVYFVTRAFGDLEPRLHRLERYLEV
jgi:hypothetical protein